jgi:hypothetical protein
LLQLPFPRLLASLFVQRFVLFIIALVEIHPDEEGDDANCEDDKTWEE